jgi:hypothetical protein
MLSYPHRDHVQLGGTLRNYNTVEAFKNADKQALFTEEAQKVKINTGYSGVDSF